MNSADLARLLARIPLLEGRRPADFEVLPLAGYTNLNLRLRSADADWVLRVPKPETDVYIDRDAETFNQALAARHGLAPLPAWRDDTAITLTPTLAARHLVPADFADRALLAEVAASFRRLHSIEARFHGRIDVGALLTRYYSLIDEGRRGAFENRFAAAQRLIPQVVERDAEFVSSHNDPVLENLLYDGDRLWLIDWEFSAMASPYWDLATLCNAADLDFQASRQLLRAYCGEDPPMDESLLFDYRNLLQLLGDCWMAALVDMPGTGTC